MAADDAPEPQEGSGAEVPDLGEIPEGATAEDIKHIEERERYLRESGQPTIEFPVGRTDHVEAAMAEVQETNHRVTYKAGEVEVELQLPPKLLASFKYRIGALDDDDPGVLRLIKRLVGPAEYEKVMDAMDEAGLYDEDGEPNAEAMTSFGEFLNNAMATYGMTPGESKASTT